MSENQAFDSWCVVELLGHVKMAGRLTEEERFGSKLGRLEIPTRIPCVLCDGNGWQEGGRGPMGEVERLACVGCDGNGINDGFSTVFFGGSSVYRISPCSEEVARHVAKRNQPEPVHAWEMPKQLEATAKRHEDTLYADDRRYDDRDEEDDDDSREMDL